MWFSSSQRNCFTIHPAMLGYRGIRGSLLITASLNAISKLPFSLTHTTLGIKKTPHGMALQQSRILCPFKAILDLLSMPSPLVSPSSMRITVGRAVPSNRPLNHSNHVENWSRIECSMECNYGSLSLWPCLGFPFNSLTAPGKAYCRQLMVGRRGEGRC